MATLFSRKAVAVTFAVLGLTLAGGGIAVAQPTEADGRAAQPTVRHGQPTVTPENAQRAREALKQGAGALATTVSSAVVRANGTLVRGVDAAYVIKYGTGQYEVGFTRVVSAGTYIATIGNETNCCIPPGGEVSVAPRLGITNAVFVQTRNSSGSYADRGFHLHVAG